MTRTAADGCGVTELHHDFWECCNSPVILAWGKNCTVTLLEVTVMVL